MTPEALQRLQQLEDWTDFHQTDGYLTLTYTDSGMVTLACQHEISNVDYADVIEEHDAGIPVLPNGDSRGWVGEFQASFKGEHCNFPGESGHYWARGKTFEDVIHTLYVQIALSVRCRFCIDRS